MFMQRLISTLILIPLVLGIILYAPLGFIIGLIVLVMAALSKEWAPLIPFKHLPLQIVFILVVLLSLWGCQYVFDDWLLVALVLWPLIALAILTYPRSQAVWGYPVVVSILCLILLPIFGQSLLHIYNLSQGKALLLYLLCLVWAADIGAYLAGKAMGAHKLIPHVSPGKSWEGVFGGLLAVSLVAVAGFFYFAPSKPGCWFTLALGLLIVSIVGDLFVSLLKRRCHLKDTGALIPGHGGLLDRLDSLIAAAPWFYFGISQCS